MMSSMNMEIRSIATLVAVLAIAAPASAQNATADARWLPFVGCWEAIGGEEEIGLLCFKMEGEGVTLTNYVGGEIASTETLVADGRRQQVSVEGCEGFETVGFSADGRRVFTDTEFLCGTEEARTGSGVMAFLTPNTWADIRTLQAGDEPFAWVQEYRLVGVDRVAEEGAEDPSNGLGMAVRTARAAAAAALDLEDVIEASAQMDDKAVETWLVARRDNFTPNAQDLVQLADAGVSDNVIDAVVAVSHPDRFLVDAGGTTEQFAGQPRPTHYRGYMGYNPFWGPAWGVAMGYGYAPYGLGYGYAPGYGYYPGYGPGYGYGYWGYRPGYVVVGPKPRGGRVYNGRGYSSGRSSSGSSSGGSAVRGRSAQPRGGAQPGYSVGGSRPSAGSGGAASPAPRSGGRQATPRRAQRRPGGGR
jgi:hypothetical protein